MIRLGVCLFLCVVLAGSAWCAPPAELVGKAYAWDSDDLVIDGKRVRLHGIDAFERYQMCRSGGRSWLRGMEAWRALQDLVAGQHVRCVLAQVKESRALPVMRCYAGELELNAEMVRLGLALECFRFSRGRYEAIEEEARAARRGAWAGTFETPAASKGQNYCAPR